LKIVDLPVFGFPTNAISGRVFGLEWFDEVRLVVNVVMETERLRLHFNQFGFRPTEADFLAVNFN